MSVWAAYFTVAEAAAALGMSQSRVRSLIEAGVLDADKVAGRWLITPESVHGRNRNQRRRGRPLKPDVLWNLIESGFIGRLLVRSDEAARHNLRIQLVQRAAIQDVYVLPQLIRRIEPVIALGGRMLAEEARVPAGRGRWEFDAYMHASDVEALRRTKIISGVKGRPNVRLHVVDEVEREWHRSLARQLLVAWLDLADEGDRAVDITLNALLAELGRSGVERFPVGNEVVAKVSLGTLAALHQEMQK